MKLASKITKAMSAVAIASALVMPTAAYASDYQSSCTFHVKAEATQMYVAIPTNMDTIESMDTTKPLGGLPIFMKSGFPIKLHSITEDHNGKITFNFEWNK